MMGNVAETGKLLTALADAVQATVAQVATSVPDAETGDGVLTLNGPRAVARELQHPQLLPALHGARMDFRARIVACLKNWAGEK